MSSFSFNIETGGRGGGWASLVIPTLIGSLFIAAGIGVCGFGIHQAVTDARIAHWQSVPCVIARSDVEKTRRSVGEYQWQVEYTYVLGGKTYKAQRYTTDYTPSAVYGPVGKLAFEYPVGTATNCFVDPSNPSHAVLRLSSSNSVFVILFGLFFAAFATVWLSAWWWLSKRQGRGGAPTGPVSQTRPSHTKLLLGLFLAVFAAVGAGFGWFFFIHPLIEGHRALTTWQPTPCTIISSRVATQAASSSDDSDTYSVDLLYRYRFADKDFESDRYNFQGGSSSGYTAKQKIVARYPVRARATCLVNPANPAEAVFVPNLDRSSYYFALIPLVFLLIGGGGLTIMAVRSIRGDTVGQIPALSRAKLSTSTAADRASAQTQMLQLRSASRPVTQTLGLTMFALLWNGILSAFIVITINEWRAGKQPIGESIFLVPFLAIGLAIIAMMVKSLLSIRNPSISLTLARGSLRLGESTDFQWTISGGHERISRLSIKLLGREQDTGSVSSTSAIKRGFALIDLVDTMNPLEIASGKGRISIPRDSVPTLHAMNNQLNWVLAVRGEIERWPDLAEEFELDVGPQAAPAPAPFSAAASAPADPNEEIVIQLDHSGGNFAPGDTGSGKVTWSLAKPAQWLEIRLVWFIRDKGQIDSTVVNTVRVETPAMNDHKLFRFVLPHRPYSSTGSLFSVVWAIEVVAEPGDRASRLEIVVAPGGREVCLLPEAVMSDRS